MVSTASHVSEEYPVTFSIERSVLLKSLSRLQSIVEKRNTIPILANIKLDCSGDSLQLTATDMDLVATETIEANIEGGGALTVPASTLYDIVRKLPDGSQIEVDTDFDSAQLVIRSGKSEFKLSYLPASDFPVMSEGELSHSFTIAAGDFLSLLEKTRFAMSNEETRYYLNGVYLHVGENKSGSPTLKAVATDGHRLAMLETAVPEGAEGMPGIIIPRKTVNEISRILGEVDAEVNVSLSDSKIRFDAANITLLSKLVDGTFPDYTRVIPQENDKLMEVETKVLNNAVDRVSTISSDKVRGIKFSLSEGKLELNSQSADSGTAEEEIDVSYSSEALQIGFNSRYMLEMLSQLEGDTSQYRLSDSNAPVLVSDPSDVSALYVIMPMRV